MEWSGAIRLEIESMQVEIYTDITNMIKQGDEFHKETENK
jgi:hypothetical protein